MKACRSRHTDIVGLLLEQPGINVNGASKFGTTALMISTGQSSCEITQLLLNCEFIDIYAEDMNKESAISIAFGSRNIEVIAILLNHVYAVDPVNFVEKLVRQHSILFSQFNFP